MVFIEDCAVGHVEPHRHDRKHSNADKQYDSYVIYVAMWFNTLFVSTLCSNRN